MVDWLSTLLILAGLGFFIAGSVGLIRLPDLYCRLHALAKADNPGLGLLILGLMLRSGDPLMVLKLLLIWVMVLTASAAGSQLIAGYHRRVQMERQR